MHSFPYIPISIDPNDKDSIYLPDIVGWKLGIKEAKNNIKQFLEREESKIKKIEDNIPNMVALINSYFGEK